jgi:hypothetical protein
VWDGTEGGGDKEGVKILLILLVYYKTDGVHSKYNNVRKRLSDTPPLTDMLSLIKRDNIVDSLKQIEQKQLSGQNILTLL